MTMVPNKWYDASSDMNAADLEPLASILDESSPSLVRNDRSETATAAELAGSGATGVTVNANTSADGILISPLGEPTFEYEISTPYDAFLTHAQYKDLKAGSLKQRGPGVEINLQRTSNVSLQDYLRTRSRGKTDQCGWVTVGGSYTCKWFNSDTGGTETVSVTSIQTENEVVYKYTFRTYLASKHAAHAWRDELSFALSMLGVDSRS